MNKKTVLITGATSGMGLSASRLFLEREWTVLMADLKDYSLEEIYSILDIDNVEQKYANKIFYSKCDVSKVEDVENIFSFSQKRIGFIHSVINNAGIAPGGMLHETSLEVWDRVFDVDVKSILLTSKFFIPEMIKHGGGTIVNTASVSGLYGDYGMAAYNAAKGAVVNLARSMALDYGKYNIRTNNVNPAACASPLFLDNNSQETIDSFNNVNPLRRICTPEEVAKAMYFLASDESSSTNGLNLTVSGGLEVHTGQPIQQ